MCKPFQLLLPKPILLIVVSVFCFFNNAVASFANTNVINCTITIQQEGYSNPGCIDKNSAFTVSARVQTGDPEPLSKATFSVKLFSKNLQSDPFNCCAFVGNTISATYTPHRSGTLEISVNSKGWPLCKLAETINVVESCSDSEREEVERLTDVEQRHHPFDLCSQIPAGDHRDACITCAGGNSLKPGGIWTSLGCISIEPTTMIQSFIRMGLGIAGGVAILTILVAGFMLTISQGQPKQVEEAKNLITSAVVGLLFIIFSVTILQFIGYSILRIPGFGG